MEPRVSFVVPCYNYAHFLPEAVNSLLKQTFRDLEVIIINDASPDHTAEVVSQWADDSRVRIIHHSENKGHIYSYNEGLTAARGEFIGILSADDYCLAYNAVEQQVALFDSDPEIGFVYSVLACADDSGTIGVWGPSNESHVRTGFEEFECLIRCNYVPASGTLVRRSLHDTVGYYDARLPHAADWDIWLRLSARSLRVAYLADPLYAYRKHGVNMSTGISATQEINEARLVIQEAYRSLPADAPASLWKKRRGAEHLPWFRASDAACNLGLPASAGQILFNAARLCPDILVSPSYYHYLIRLLLLVLLGSKNYSKLVSWRQSKKSAGLPGRPGFVAQIDRAA